MPMFSMTEIPRRILFEDTDILVFHKPGGVAVQNARSGEMDLESALKNYLAAKERRERGAGARSGRGRGAVPYLGVVHRLDQPVEGLLVFAKTPAAAASLGRQVQDGRMEKEYLAVVTVPEGEMREQLDMEASAVPPQDRQALLAAEGRFSPGKAPHSLEDYLVKDPRTSRAEVVPAGTAGAKKARLSWCVIEKTGEGTFLLWIHLETGRFHQIRSQLSHAGMPIRGDRKYGGLPARGLSLCAFRLRFMHPVTGRRMQWQLSRDSVTSLQG